MYAYLLPVSSSCVVFLYAKASLWLQAYILTARTALSLSVCWIRFLILTISMARFINITQKNCISSFITVPHLLDTDLFNRISCYVDFFVMLWCYTSDYLVRIYSQMFQQKILKIISEVRKKMQFKQMIRGMWETVGIHSWIHFISQCVLRTARNFLIYTLHIQTFVPSELFHMLTWVKLLS